MSKRSVNFQGSASTVARKARTPKALLETLRFCGLTDDEIKERLEQLRQQELDAFNAEYDHVEEGDK